MPLTEFEIIHARTGDDDPEICCKDGRKRVLAMVTDEAWDDVFPLAYDETLKTIQEKNILSQSNLDVLKGLIEARYAAGRYDMLNRMGSTLPLIMLKLGDLAGVKARLSRSALDVHRKARFVTV